MDDETVNCVISQALKEYKDFQALLEYNKNIQKDMTKYITLLQEELKPARDAERAADLRRNKCQVFVSQQQQAILKLLGVKEENENLKQIVHKMEKTVADLESRSRDEVMKKDAELHSFKEDYLKQLIKVQEAAEKQVLKEKNELASTVEKLHQRLSKNEEIIKRLETNIELLKTENNDLKERAKVNIIIFQQKLADQERKYQAELETWKIAEINRTVYQQALEKNTMMNYRASSLQSELFRNEPQCNMKNIQTQKHPIIKRFRNTVASIPTNVHNSSTSSSDFTKNNSFLSAGDVYYQSTREIKTDDDNEEICFNTINKNNQLKDNNNAEKKTKCSTNPNKKRKLFNTDENLL